MSDQPNVDWKHESPISKISEHNITPVPFVKTKDQVFFDELELELSCVDNETKIYYTLDESTPSENSELYETALKIDKTTVIKSFAIAKNKVASKMIEAKLYKVDQKRKIEYKNTYDTQYSGSGDMNLIDYLRGGDDYRTGAWQGWQGQDVELIVDLEK